MPFVRSIVPLGKMDSFKLDLANGWTLRGISNIPPSSKSPVEYRPLIIGLHGSTYDCRYFDGDARHTALIASNAFGVPFVAIDRPGSGETTSPLPLLSDSNFPQQTGNWLHNLIIPALWSEFGVPNGCNCVVLLCHSLGAMGGIVTGAIHAQDDNPSYLLGGIIASGIGDQLLPEMRENPIREPNVPPHHVRFPLEAKDALMFRPGTVHEDILKHTERLDTPAPFVELESLRDLCQAVLLGSVQLESLAGRGVVIQHLLQSSTDVNGVDWPELLLHVVGGKEVQNGGELQQKVVLKSEDRGWSHDGGLWEDASGNELSSSLCRKELRGRVGVGVVRRDVDITINVILGNSLGDALGSFDVHVLQRKVLGRIVSANQVVHNVRVPDACFDGSRVSKIIFNENNAAEVSSELQVSLCHFFAERDNNGTSLTGKAVYDIPAQLTRRAEHRRSVTSKR